MSGSPEKEIDSFLKHHPDVKAFDVLIPDINGVFRGKRVTLETVSYTHLTLPTKRSV